MKRKRELKALAIRDDFKFHKTEVVISYSKEMALYWTRDKAGYTNEEMNKFKVNEFPLDETITIKDYGKTTARELLSKIQTHKYPIVVFWKEHENDYYENWLSNFDSDEE